jgi:hypothetical protein
MTAIIGLIFTGLLVYGIWQTVSQPAPDERPKCCVCGTTKRSLQWLKSWKNWYCWPCKEERIHAVVRILMGEQV